MLFHSRGVIVSVMLIGFLGSFAAAASDTNVNDIVQLEKKPIFTPTAIKGVNLTPPLAHVENNGDRTEAITKTRTLNGYLLSTEDRDNLSNLWKRVIDKNTIIQYGLKQLATPPELRYAHSSAMSRAMGGLLSGAGMLPYMMGVDAFSATATSMSTQMVDRAMTNSKKMDPNKLPSDTDLVELSGIIQDLQESLVESYFRYKSSLTSVAQLNQLAAKIESDRSRIDPFSNPQDSLWINDLYQNTAMQRLQANQVAKRNYIVLERLVGIDGMKQLQFADNQAATATPIQTLTPLSAMQTTLPTGGTH